MDATRCKGRVKWGKPADPFPEDGPPGPLGRELLQKFAAAETLAAGVTIEAMFDGLRPRWAAAAACRLVAAKLLQREKHGGGPDRFTLTERGREEVERLRALPAA